MDESYESRRVWNAHLSYLDSNGDKPAYLSTMFTLEASGALPQFGDSNAHVDRIRQLELAGMQGIRRETLTKRMSRIAAPDPNWTPEKRAQASEKMKAIAANHPHWEGKEPHRGDAETRRDEENADREEFTQLSDVDASGVSERDHRAAGSNGAAVIRDRGISGFPPQTGIVVPVDRTGASSESGGSASANHVPGSLGEDGEPGVTSSASPRLRSEHSRPCILTRNPGFGCANTYALAMPDEARPGLKAEADPTQHAGILAAHFGPDVYDATAKVNGWRKAWGWNFVAELKDAPDCACRQQKSFEFQRTCGKCEGRGFTIGGSMPDFGRVILHFLNTRGIDQEIRRCQGCNRRYSVDQAKNWPKCPGCQNVAPIVKQKDILTGWTQQAIADFLGLHVSTVRRYFETFRRLGLIRTVNGEVWRKCCGPLYNEKSCPKCGNKAGEIKKRDPWKILWLVGRTFDRDLVKAEQQRLEALLRLHRRWLELRQQEALAAAVALAVRVLGEWAGSEHQLMSFYHEMRRRLNTAEHARFINVLFPLNTS